MNAGVAIPTHLSKTAEKVVQELVGLSPALRSARLKSLKTKSILTYVLVLRRLSQLDKAGGP